MRKVNVIVLRLNNWLAPPLCQGLKALDNTSLPWQFAREFEFVRLAYKGTQEWIRNLLKAEGAIEKRYT